MALHSTSSRRIGMVSTEPVGREPSGNPRVVKANGDRKMVSTILTVVFSVLIAAILILAIVAVVVIARRRRRQRLARASAARGAGVAPPSSRASEYSSKRESRRKTRTMQKTKTQKTTKAKTESKGRAFTVKKTEGTIAKATARPQYYEGTIGPQLLESKPNVPATSTMPSAGTNGPAPSTVPGSSTKPPSSAGLALSKHTTAGNWATSAGAAPGTADVAIAATGPKTGTSSSSTATTAKKKTGMGSKETMLTVGTKRATATVTKGTTATRPTGTSAGGATGVATKGTTGAAGTRAAGTTVAATKKAIGGPTKEKASATVKVIKETAMKSESDVTKAPTVPSTKFTEMTWPSGPLTKASTTLTARTSAQSTRAAPFSTWRSTAKEKGTKQPV